MKKVRQFHSLLIVALIAAAMMSFEGCGNKVGNQNANENEETDSAYTQRLANIMDFLNKRQMDSVAHYTSVEMERSKAHEKWYFYYYNWSLWGRALAADGKTDDANALLKEMTADAVKRNNKIGEAMSHMTMGAIYMLCNQDDEQAEKAFRQSLATYPEDADYSPKDWVYTMLIQLVSHTPRDDEFKALLDKQKEEIEKAGKVVKNGKPVSETKGYRTWRSNYYYNLYFYHYKTGNMPEATASLDTIDQLLKDDTLRRATWTLGPRLTLLVSANKLDSALSLLDHEKDILHQSYDSKKLWTHYEYHINKFRDDAPAALFYLEQLKEISDSAASADTRAKLDELNKRFEIDSVKHKAELQKSRFTNTIAIGIAVALALLLGLGLWSRSRLRKKNTEPSNNLHGGRRLAPAAESDRLHVDYWRGRFYRRGRQDSHKAVERRGFYVRFVSTRSASLSKRARDQSWHAEDARRADLSSDSSARYVRVRRFAGSYERPPWRIQYGRGRRIVDVPAVVLRQTGF